MSKIIKKSDITTLVETTMKQAGILKEEEIDKDKEEMDEACDDDMMEEEEMDIVSESTKKLAGQASEHNIISENLKKDLASFNKIINYKY
jgi:hypothetical protein